jgi:hypothetical protein
MLYIYSVCLQKSFRIIVRPPMNQPPSVPPATAATAEPLPAPRLNRVQRLFLMVKQGRILHVIKGRLKPFVIRAGQAVMKRPGLKKLIDGQLSKSPQLKLRVERVLWSEVNLPPRALRIFTQLKEAAQHPAAAQVTPLNKYPV